MSLRSCCSTATYALSWPVRASQRRVEYSGIFSLTGELNCICTEHQAQMKTASAGMELHHGGSSASTQLGTTLPLWCMTPLHLKQRAYAGCSLSDVMIQFCCKDTILFNVLCKLQDGKIDFYVVAHQCSEICSDSYACTVILLKQPLQKWERGYIFFSRVRISESQ